MQADCRSVDCGSRAKMYLSFGFTIRTGIDRSRDRQFGYQRHLRRYFREIWIFQEPEASSRIPLISPAGFTPRQLQLSLYRRFSMTCVSEPLTMVLQDPMS